jgi:hypothetical protein
MVDAAEAVEIDTILEYCGFTDQARRADIAADGFESYDDVNTLTEKDIGSLAKGFAKRTTANGKITFGLRQTNLLKATIHWAQDFRRISRVPTLDNIADQAEFREALETARLPTSADKEAQCGGVGWPQLGCRSWQVEEAKGMDHMVQSPQELRVNHSRTEWCPSILRH